MFLNFVQFYFLYDKNINENIIILIFQVRKLFNCGAFLFQTIFMTCTGFISTTAGVVISITIAVGLGGFAWSGFG